MSSSKYEPGSYDPDVVASLKELARKGSRKHRIVCESDAVATEYWLGRRGTKNCRNWHREKESIH